MIEAQNISVETKTGKLILDHVSSEIRPGVLSSVIGKNGAGKSTLLKAICGENSISSGKVLFENQPASNINLHEIAKKRAVVSQKTTLDFSFSVDEVVMLGRSPYTGFFRSEKNSEIVDECLEKVGLSALKHRSYITLSGGEQQRVHIARALAQIWNAIQSEQPSYLFLDEPLASLDVAHQHGIMSLLKQLCSKNVGVFIVIHDLNLAAQYSDNVVILKNGKKITEGSPNEVFTEEIIFNAFDHPVNIIPHPKTECPLIISKPELYSGY